MGMTVAELIAKLKEFDKDMEVYTNAVNFMGIDYATDVYEEDTPEENRYDDDDPPEKVVVIS